MASLSRGRSAIAKLDQRFEWFPIALNDEITVTSGKLDILINGQPVSIAGPKKLKLDRDTMIQLKAIAEGRRNLSCVRHKGDPLISSNPNAKPYLYLNVPVNSRLYPGTRAEVPAIYWLAGGFKTVVFQVTSTRGQPIYGPFEWEASTGAAKPIGLFERLEQVPRGAIVFLEMFDKQKPERKARVRCQVSSEGDPAPIPGASGIAARPSELLATLDRDDGWLKRRYYLEAVDYLMRARSRRPHSLFVTAVLRTTADQLKLSALDESLLRGFDQDLYEEWLSPEVIDL